MSKDKQIEEMALDVHQLDFCMHLEEKECDATTCCHCTAEALYNAGYRKKEWISVDDRLPEESGEYLTFHEHGSCGVIYYNAAIHLWNVYYFDDVRNAIRSVTHWMPLPEAPKGGAEA